MQSNAINSDWAGDESRLLKTVSSASDTADDTFTYKPTKINNRRYLGNKYRLLPFIVDVVKSECQEVHVVADIFAGTGAVSSAFVDKQLITNDILYSNYICQKAWFGTESYSKKKVATLISRYNSYNDYEENYMTENFADTYFSRRDCSKIGYIRQNIEELREIGDINDREHAILITSLLYAMDRIANTCGHYDAYRRGVDFDRPIELSVPTPENYVNQKNECYNTDANELVKTIKADLVYLDPPYNSRQYCDAYHLLENVAKWEKPPVHGVAKKMNRLNIKSDYCTKKAVHAFEELIDNIDAKYILLSYNNMAEKGNDRSNAKISDEDIMRILSKKGKVKIFEEDYRAFSAGKSNIAEHSERLFLCTCVKAQRKQEFQIVRSPLNYTGGKFRLLPQLLPLFPKKPHTVIDLFCGGCEVGINISAEKIIFNDANEKLIELLKTFANTPKPDTLNTLFALIEQYNLSRTDRHDYAYYDCNGSDGLVSYNSKAFLQLRQDYNSLTTKDAKSHLMLYLLIVFAFNNQIRFNNKGEYNLPVGKRDFNIKMQNKLSDFIDKIQTIDCEFRSCDFRNIEIPKTKVADSGMFIYADPPYLITCASYNEKNGWTKTDEYDLLNFLEHAHKSGHLFALSNVIESGGRRNEILSEWADRHADSFNMTELNMDYSNSNYHRKNRNAHTKEVLIRNYE